MIRRTNAQIKEEIKTEYSGMREAGCNYLKISRVLARHYNPRLIIESIQEWNDERCLVA